jgi:hypothetical protein
MNLRHVAALALVGWYLMVPPFGFRPDNKQAYPDSREHFSKLKLLAPAKRWVAR